MPCPINCLPTSIIQTRHFLRRFPFFLSPSYCRLKSNEAMTKRPINPWTTRPTVPNKEQDTGSTSCSMGEAVPLPEAGGISMVSEASQRYLLNIDGFCETRRSSSSIILKQPPPLRSAQ